MDFITDLQNTAEGFDSILVCTDRLSRYSYLIPTKKSDTSLITARRLFQVVFTVHGPPKRLITDRDTRWVSGFYSELMRIMDITQSMGTSHYHDFNGLSENVNRTVEVMLRHVLTDHPGRDFTDVIPMCQYAYNTAHHSAIGTSPYFASWGFEPRNPTMFRVTMDPTGHPAVEEFVDHQQVVITQVRDALFQAQRTMEEYENQKRKDVNFTVGQKVFLNTRNLSGIHFKKKEEKFHERFCGPFTIV